MEFEREPNKHGDVYKQTANRSTYNKARKKYLEGTGQIRCSWCGYHKNENSKSKWYGGFTEDSITYPSWKSTNKVRKQWMKEVVVIEKTEHRRYSRYDTYTVKLK